MTVTVAPLKHIFNPAAFGVALTALFLGLSATWWVGTGVMMPFVVIGVGLLLGAIVRWRTREHHA